MAVLAAGTLDAVPGDPATLYEAADHMDRSARRFEDTADSIGSHGRAVTANWYGSASDAAGEHIQGLSVRVRVGHDVMAGVAKVIRTYAAALAAAQDAWSEASVRAQAASTALGKAHAAAAAASAMPTTDASGQVDHAASCAQAIAAQDAAAAARSAGAALSEAQQDMAAAVAAAVAAALDANTDAARQVQAYTDELAAMGAQPAASAGGLGGTGMSGAAGGRVLGVSYDLDAADGSTSGADGVDGSGGGQGVWDWISATAQDLAGEADAQLHSVIDFYRDHPDELAKTVRDAGLMALGAVLMTEAVGGELLGAALDVTGVGAPVGVPINIAEAGVLVAGAGSALAGGAGPRQSHEYGA